MKTKKELFIESLKKECANFTRNNGYFGSDIYREWNDPILPSKYQIKDWGQNQIQISCKRCWTDELIKVARKVAIKRRAKVENYHCMGGFGTAYNFFIIHI